MIFDMVPNDITSVSYTHLDVYKRQDDRRVGVIENLAILYWIFPLLLIPDGVGVGLACNGQCFFSHDGRRFFWQIL